MSDQQSNGDRLFERAKELYPDRDPEVDWLYRDLSKLPIVEQRGGMNACVYIPVFNGVLKYLHREGMDATLPTILLITMQRFLLPILSDPAMPNPYMIYEMDRFTLGAMSTTIQTIAEYLTANPECTPARSY